MPSPQRARALFLAGVAAFAALALAGGVVSLLVDHRLPGIWSGYVDSINQLLGRGDAPGALRQMRLAVELNPDDGAKVDSILPQMARLAHDVGSRDDELRALRMLAMRNPLDASIHERLATALLDQEKPSMDVLREASAHAETAVRLDFHSARGWSDLAAVAHALGQEDKSREFLHRAYQIDPTLDSAAFTAGAWTGQRP